MQQLWARLDLGVMAMKGYSAFPKSPALQKSHNQIVKCYIQDTGWRSLTPLQRCSLCILQPRSLGHSWCWGAHGVIVIAVGNGHEFKSRVRLIAFHIALIPLGKVWIQLFSLQLWVNSRADWVLQPWWGNLSRRRNTLNLNLVNSA